MRAVVIDDEARGRKLLVTMLEKFCPDVHVAAVAGSVMEGRAAIGTESPDLVFLDVEMPPGNGFELLESLDRIDFKVIFVTAHDHYALRAIKFSALDFLLKPIDVSELTRAVAKAKETISPRAAESQFKALFQNLHSRQTRIGLPTRNGLVFVQVGDIVRFQADSNYTRIFLTSGEKYVAARTLKEFDSILGGMNFLRTHQSHLVNAAHVREYIRGDGGTLVLSDGSRVEVSRRHKEIVLKRLADI